MVEIAGLGNFRLRGSGGFADVYEADEVALSRRVAAKLFRARVGGDDRRSFEREAHALGRLSGIRNVVQVYRSGITDDDHPYFVMELMDGSLADVLAAGPIPAADVCRAGVLVGHALLAAHREGILHRDIKPGNILIDRYGEPALSDFGISGLADAGTSSFIYAFTAEHAAPEVFDRLDPTPAADVYSLASTLYAAMEGHAPFERDEGEGALTFMRRVQETPCPPCTAAAALDPALDIVLRSALAKDPTDRPVLGDLVAVLGEYASSGDVRSDAQPLVLAPQPHLVAPSSGTPTGDPSDPGDPSGAGGASTPGGPSDPGRSESRSSGRRLTIAAVALIAIVIAGVGATVWAMSNGEDQEALRSNEVKSVAGTDTTATSTSSTVARVSTEQRANGVTNARPAVDAGVIDSSGVLRSDIEAFAAASTVAAVNAPVTQRDLDGAGLRFGTPPARLDYAATNAETTTKCLKVYAEDLLVTGAAGTFWSDGQIVVGLNAVEFQTELQAKQYYWSTALFFGLGDANCNGWPEDEIAVNPEDLSVDRHDFALATPTDDSVTVINDEPALGGIKGTIQYEVVSRLGDLVITASVTAVSAGLDPELATSILNDAIAAFPPA